MRWKLIACFESLLQVEIGKERAFRDDGMQCALSSLHLRVIAQRILATLTMANDGVLAAPRLRNGARKLDCLFAFEPPLP